MIANSLFSGACLGGPSKTFTLSGFIVDKLSADDQITYDKAADTGNDKELLDAAVYFSQKGKKYFKDNQFSLAFSYYNSAASLYDSPTSEYNAGRCLQELSMAYEGDKDFINAIEVIKESIGWFELAKATGTSLNKPSIVSDSEDQLLYANNYLKYLNTAKEAWDNKPPDKPAPKKETIPEPPPAPPKPKTPDAVEAKNKPGSGTVKQAGVGAAGIIAGAFVVWLLMRGK